MTYKEAMMVLENMRDQRLSVQMLNELLVKAQEAEGCLQSAAKQRAAIDADIGNAELVRQKVFDDLEKFKADLAKQSESVAVEKAKLEADFQAAVARAQEANRMAELAEKNAAAVQADLDKQIAAKEKQLDQLQKNLKSFADKAAAMAG